MILYAFMIGGNALLAGVNLKNLSALYQDLSRSPYFVDKTGILDQLIPFFSTNMKYICITRPRRFGKSSITQMLAAYLSKCINTESIFNCLAVAHQPYYRENLNRHNVVYMDLSRLPRACVSYNAFEDMLSARLISDLKKQFPVRALYYSL